MDQANLKAIARTLVAVVVLQFFTIGAVVYLLVATHAGGNAADVENARYQQSVAEYKKTMEEYRDVTAKYQAALDEWKKLTDYSPLSRSQASELEPLQSSGPTSDLRSR